MYRKIINLGTLFGDISLNVVPNFSVLHYLSIDIVDDSHKVFPIYR